MPKKYIKLPKAKSFTGPASVWKRLLAFIIDLMVINLIIVFPFRKIFQKITPTSYSETYNFLLNNPGYTKLMTVITITIGLLALLYFVILENRLQQTIGKILLNIYIVSDKKKLRFWQVLVRSLFLLPAFPFFLLWVIDPLFLFFTKNNQRLSEIISKTRTVENYVY